MLDTARDKASPIYTGLREQHTVHYIESLWVDQSATKNFPERLQTLHTDTTATQLAQAAWERGDREITVVDIGSGEDALLVNSFEDKETFPQLHSFLSNHHGFTTHILGVTSSVVGNNQGDLIHRKDVRIGDGPLASHLTIESRNYTITKGNTLKDLLNHVGARKLNLVMSTFGLGYFTPANFEQCISDVTSRMTADGRFYCIAYDAVPSGAKRGPNGIFTLTGEAPSDHPLSVILDSIHFREAYDTFHQLPWAQQIEKYLEAADFYIERNWISPDTARSIIQDLPIVADGTFIENFASYLSEKQKKEFQRFFSSFVRKHVWLQDVEWKLDTHFLSDIGARESAYELAHWPERKPSTNNARDLLRRMSGKKLELTPTVKDQISSFVENKYAKNKMREVIQDKNRFNQDIRNSSWEEIKVKIQGLHQADVAQYWLWDDVPRKLQNITVAKIAKKTSLAKQAVLDRFRQDPTLEVYSGQMGNMGTNFYIGRKKQ